MATQRGIYEEEGAGIALGAMMAQALRNRVKNPTDLEQRIATLKELAAGPRRDQVAQNEISEFERMQMNESPDILEAMRTNRELTERLAREEELQRMQMAAANPPGRIPPLVQEEVYQDELGALNAEEGALLAQMQADMTNQAGPQGFTSPGYVPGGADALPPAAQPPQTPQIAGSTGTSQAAQPGAQGFTSPGYTSTPTPEGEQVDTVGRNAAQWVNDLFMGKGDQGAAGQEGAVQTEDPSPDLPNAQGFVSPTYQSSTPAGPLESPPAGTPGGASTSSGIDTYTTQHGFGAKNYAQGGLNPGEQEILNKVQSDLQASSPDGGADSQVSWPTIGGPQTPGGFTSEEPYDSGVGRLPDESFIEYTQRMHQRLYGGAGKEATNQALVGQLLDKYGDQLRSAGYGALVDKFSSGDFNKSDVDALIGQYGRILPQQIVNQLEQVSANLDAEVAGAEVASPWIDPDTGQEFFPGSGMTGDQSRDRTRELNQGVLGKIASEPGLTFQAKTDTGTYDAGVAMLPGESFIEYTQRMHNRLYPQG
jgi:hypothetical protein